MVVWFNTSLGHETALGVREVDGKLAAASSLARLIVDPPMGYDEPETLSYAIMPFCPTSADEIKNHQLSWWFDGEPLKAVSKDSATFGMGLWDH